MGSLSSRIGLRFQRQLQLRVQGRDAAAAAWLWTPPRLCAPATRRPLLSDDPQEIRTLNERGALLLLQ